MSLFTSSLRQSLTVWTRTGFDAYGKPTFSTPNSSTKCRWEDRSELVKTPSNDDVMTKARVFVSLDVVLGDYLFLGISSASTPIGLAGAQAVILFKKIPTLNGKDFSRVAYL